MAVNTWSGLLSLCVVASGTSAACGDIIVGPAGLGYGSTSFYQIYRIGQSFTATLAEPVVGTVSFRWWQVNLQLPDPNITVRLREGFGFGGTVLASQSRTVPDSMPNEAWVDFVFPALVPLEPGQVYSLEFALEPAVNSSGGYFHVAQGPYTGGMFINGNGTPSPLTDVCFRVLTVPGPGVAVAVGLGMGLMSRRRRAVMG